ncbi:FkbM family methyltransferase [Falsiroseomonas oryzae]|uniref:FkbM family methyltransferase n=1 Tax=Falsiroseomonas oryzae TaxID=2766473 RepID=UPI0022EB25C6|nr:FkbM family methyltransferase [Roseomonas sp. MO-31]
MAETSAQANGTEIPVRTVETRYGSMKIFANDTGAAPRSLAIYGEWAEHEIAFLKSFLEPGATVVDAGAFVGTHTLSFSRIVGPDGMVVSFEAQAETFALLRDNVSVNGATNVRLENAAVMDRVGELQGAAIDPTHENSFGSASLVDPAATDHAGVSRVMRATTIDALGLAACALIKIDVEGAEDAVIRGAAETIRRFSPVIFAECNSVEAGLRTLAELRALGYVVRLHVADAFNADNFRAVRDNMFGNAREASLVGVPAAQSGRLDRLAPKPWEMLLAIETADDLVLGMLNKPQYLEVLQAGAAARTGGEAWLRSQVVVPRRYGVSGRLERALDALLGR